MFEVYATRWDTPGIVSQLIPAKGLSFSFPLSAHGEASFSATVEPGRSFWRSSIGGIRSGILIAETNTSGTSVPLWAGRIKDETQQPGTRQFSFTCQEWGSALDWFPAIVDRWQGIRDTATYVDIINRAQAVPGQNLRISTQGAGVGKAVSDYEVKAWDTLTVAEQLAQIAGREGGPEWYVTVGGTLRTPIRQLIVGDLLGSQTPQKVLEYVEDTPDRPQTSSRSRMALLSQLFPGGAPVWSSGRLGRRGGNVLAAGRGLDAEKAATVVVAIGAGQEAAQIRATAVAQDLLDAGFPRITKFVQFDSVTNRTTLQRHADAELAACRGMLADYSLVTRGSAPNWREVPRGSMLSVELDTDVYASARPLKITSRLLNMTVAVPDDGGQEQVRWDIGQVLEVA